MLPVDGQEGSSLQAQWSFDIAQARQGARLVEEAIYVGVDLRPKALFVLALDGPREVDRPLLHRRRGKTQGGVGQEYLDRPALRRPGSTADPHRVPVLIFPAVSLLSVVLYVSRGDDEGEPIDATPVGVHYDAEKVGVAQVVALGEFGLDAIGLAI